MDRVEDIAERLRRLRLAYGFDLARAWCEWIEVTESVWNPFEKGTRRISLDIALKVCARTGASLDWIYRGMEHTLPPQVFERILTVPTSKVTLVDRRKRA
jgi:transcriptional regulator with XRE-family HTH domain